jgi:hypothetical protein
MPFWQYGPVLTYRDSPGAASRWAGGTISSIGTQVTQFAMPLAANLLFDIDGNSLAAIAEERGQACHRILSG